MIYIVSQKLASAVTYYHLLLVHFSTVWIPSLNSGSPQFREPQVQHKLQHQHLNVWTFHSSTAGHKQATNSPAHLVNQERGKMLLMGPETHLRHLEGNYGIEAGIDALIFPHKYCIEGYCEWINLTLLLCERCVQAFACLYVERRF